jgi:DNA modification methylase
MTTLYGATWLIAPAHYRFKYDITYCTGFIRKPRGNAFTCHATKPRAFPYWRDIKLFFTYFTSFINASFGKPSWYIRQAIAITGTVISTRFSKLAYRSFYSIFTDIAFNFHSYNDTLPIKQIQYLIKSYSNDGDLILDPFMGAGSTAQAAANLNRRFIGMELDALYFDRARARLCIPALAG